MDDIYFDLHNLYWNSVWDEIQMETLNGQTVMECVLETLKIIPSMDETGRFIIFADEYSHTIELEQTLFAQIESDIEAAQRPDGTFDEAETEMLLRWKKTLNNGLILINLALKIKDE